MQFTSHQTRHGQSRGKEGQVLGRYPAKSLCASPQVETQVKSLWTTSTHTAHSSRNDHIQPQQYHRHMTRTRSQAVTVMTRKIYTGLSLGIRELAYSHAKRKMHLDCSQYRNPCDHHPPQELNLCIQGAIRWGRFARLSVIVRPYTAKSNGAGPDKVLSDRLISSSAQCLL